jgi:hypothetical protein
MITAKQYDDLCKKAGLNYSAQAQHPAQQQTKDMLTPTSPIQTALTLLDARLGDLQATVERLFSALRPVTTNTDDNRCGESAAAWEGTSPLTLDLNAKSARLEQIIAGLQSQVDKLEV